MTKINEIGVAGRYPVHTLCLRVRETSNSTEKRFKGKRLEIPVKKALARGVALLGVKVTGIEPPRLTFVTVYRLPIRLPAKSALTSWPVV